MSKKEVIEKINLTNNEDEAITIFNSTSGREKSEALRAIRKKYKKTPESLVEQHHLLSLINEPNDYTLIQTRDIQSKKDKERSKTRNTP